MKTLNRTLSLVLVLVMVLGMFGVASAAQLGDFTDKDDIKYKEAVDYLTAAGIVAGETATTINPKGEVTREQAAKLMAYAMLGQAAADNLKAGAAPFKDVEADRWSAGYIAYCVQAGVINGLGDGTFAPTEKVTGYQMAKMLLCALGYGVNGEFTGAGWALETAKYALAKDIFYGNVAGASDAPANREEAFLYTFNTLTRAMLVKYNDTLKVYYSGTNPFENDQKANVDYTIGLQRFKMEWVTGVSTYSEPTHYWAINGKKVTGTYPNDPVVILATSSNGSPYDKLTNKGNTDYIGYTGNKTIGYYINGDDASLDTVSAAASIRGNVINFIDTDKDGKYDVVEALVYKVAKLSADPTIRTAGGNSVVTMVDLGMKDIVDDNIDGDFEDLKKDDYVLYYHNTAKTSWTIEKAESITGQLFGYNDTAKMVNVNGTNYNVSTIHANYQANATAANLAVQNAFDAIAETAGLAGTVFFLDAGKNIVAAEPTQHVIAADNVVFVLGTDTKLGVVSAKLLKSDGTAVIKTVTKVINEDNEALDAVGNVSDNTFYTFTEADGAMVLKDIDPSFVTSDTTYVQADKDKKVFEKGSAKFFYKKDGTADSVLGTSKTVFVLEGDGTAVGTYKAYTGVSNIPTVKVKDAATTTAAYVLKDKNGYAVMAVALRGALDTTVTTLGYVFVGAPGSVVQMTGNASENYYSYQYAVIDGEIKTVDSVNTLELNPGIYAIDGYDNNKIDSVVTGAALANTRIAGISGKNATRFVVNGNTVTPSGGNATSFVVSDDVKVFVFDAYDKAAGKVYLDKVALGSIENLRGDKYTLAGLRVSDKDNTVNELYIVIEPKDAVVATGIKSVTLSGSAYTVNYYGDTAPTEDEALAAVQAQIAKDGFNIKSVTYTPTTYTFDLTKTIAGSEVDVPDRTFNNTSVVQLYRVTVDGTEDYLPVGTTITAAGGTGSYAKVGNTYVATSTAIADGKSYETGFYNVAVPTTTAGLNKTGWTIATTAPAYAKEDDTYTITVTTDGTSVGSSLKLTFAGTGATATLKVDNAAATSYTSATAHPHTATEEHTYVFTVTVGTADVTGNTVAVA